MYRGPIDHICPECGANNSISAYVEYIDCYACGNRINFKEGTKKYLKQRLPQSIDRTKAEDKDSKHEKDIFNALALSDAERKYIHVKKDAVYFAFPLKAEFKIWVGGKKLPLDIRENDAIYKKIVEFFGDELCKEGFQMGNPSYVASTLMGEIDFYKNISSDGEAKEAVKWLIDFKKRFGF